MEQLCIYIATLICNQDISDGLDDLKPGLPGKLFFFFGGG
jgi:hypothetical protein